MDSLKNFLMQFVPKKKTDAPTFATTPKDLVLESPYKIRNPDRIYLGDNIRLGPYCVFMPITQYPTKYMQHKDYTTDIQKFDSKIVIGNAVTATAGLQIAAQEKVIIEDHVMFASNVFINDGSHGYETAEIPYKYQPILKIAPVIIRSGCWIGQNVVVAPGVEIGMNSIIGANSVVTHSIPEKAIAFGAPARVVKLWNDETKTWVPV